MSLKRCKVCKQQFRPTRPMQPTCHKYECQVSYAQQVADKARKKREKVERAADRQKREKLKTVTDHANDTQRIVNKYIRLRDLKEGRGCISCGTKTAMQWHAGHYRNVKTHKSIRFDHRNIHLQCSQCNDWEGGNKIEYRKGLLERVGVDVVEWLEAQHDTKRWSVEELKQIQDLHKKLIKDLDENQKQS